MSASTFSSSTSGDAPLRASSAFSRPAALIGGGAVLVAATAIATTLVMRPASHDSASKADAGVATPAVTAQALASPQKSGGSVTDPAGAAARPVPMSGVHAAKTPSPKGANDATTTVSTAAATCVACGVVESVTPVQEKGQATGAGAIGGAVVGGLLGHQMGGGTGRDAMTAVGVVGGGIAGHEIEKRARATTAYQVKVRMQDGTLRTFTQSSAPAVGLKVSVDGQKMTPRA